MRFNFLPLFVAVPLMGAFLTPLLSKLWQGLADIVANAAGVFLLGLSVFGLVSLGTGASPLVYWAGGWGPRAGLPPLGIAMVYDPLTALVVLATNIVGFCALFYSLRYMNGYTAKWKFYTLFLLILAGLNGLVVSGDLFNMFVFLEISSVASYGLVAFGTEHEELEAAFKYMVLGEIGGMSILFGIALIYARASTLNLADLSGQIAAWGHNPFFWFVIATLLVGFAIKMAMVPFHSWLPDAHPAAPAPVSALLSGIFIKVAGVYSLCRLMFNVFGLTRENAAPFFNLLLGFGVLSIVVGGLLAFAQRDYKRLLAYSSISQVGYILIGLGIGNFWGIAGALFHLLAHALSKGLLFLAAGSVESQTGTRDMGKLSGLERSMPATSWSHLFGTLSLAGVPPFAGFFSKLFIVLGAIQSRMFWLAIVAVIFSVVTLGYLTKVVNMVFFVQQGKEPTRAREAPATMVVAMVLLALLTVAIGIGFRPVLDYLVWPAAQVLLNGLSYARMVLGG
ncbi:MAG: proton-conducting transporter membrane subunit [candidate division WOR-3 bacterium]